MSSILLRYIVLFLFKYSRIPFIIDKCPLAILFQFILSTLKIDKHYRTIILGTFFEVIKILWLKGVFKEMKEH